MSKLRLKISMSLDGFVAGPEQSLKDPLGIGGERLHEWMFPTKVWHEMGGREGGIDDASSAVVAEEIANIGATIMGRNMFGGHPGGWDPENPWTGWWGKNPPFHHPVFVLTHHAREPLQMAGGNVFHFVTGGIEEALDRARAAAGGRDVSLAGGAQAAQQYLAAGLVDEIGLHLIPILLGGGERLFDGVPDLPGFELARTVATPQVVHLKLVRS